MEKQQITDQPMQFKKILVGVDRSEQGRFALANAVHQATEDDSELAIVSVLETKDLSAIDALSVNAYDAKRAEIDADLAEYKAYAETHGATNVTTYRAESESAAEAILEDVVPRVKPDLIIVGAHSRTGAWAHLVGSQASLIAKHAGTSVMVARKADAE